MRTAIVVDGRVIVVKVALIYQSTHPWTRLDERVDQGIMRQSIDKWNRIRDRRKLIDSDGLAKRTGYSFDARSSVIIFLHSASDEREMQRQHCDTQDHWCNVKFAEATRCSRKRDNEAICDGNLHGLTAVRSIRSEISPGATKGVGKKGNDEKKGTFYWITKSAKKRKGRSKGTNVH